MKRYKLYVLDLDGVLFRGNQVIAGAVETVSALQQKSVVRFLTNNSTQTRASFANKMNSMGFRVAADEIMTSAVGAGIYLKGASAFVVGEDGLREEITCEGARPVSSDEPADWVVVGACWGLTYAMIDEAQWRIRNGARFLGTNPDKTFPVESGRLRPGAGTMIAAIAAAAETEPEIVLGKPHPALLQIILDQTGTSPENTLLVGDRLDTDIECAIRAGCDSALALTGVSTREDIDRLRIWPSYVLDALSELAVP